MRLELRLAILVHPPPLSPPSPGINREALLGCGVGGGTGRQMGQATVIRGLEVLTELCCTAAVSDPGEFGNNSGIEARAEASRIQWSSPVTLDQAHIWATPSVRPSQSSSPHWEPRRTKDQPPSQTLAHTHTPCWMGPSSNPAVVRA